MPRYVVERNFGQISPDELEQAAMRSKRVMHEEFSDLGWDHSHVTNTDNGLLTYCIYEAPSADRIRAHAAAAGLPADQVHEIVTDVDPKELP